MEKQRQEGWRPESLSLVDLLKTRKGFASCVQRQTVNKEWKEALLGKNCTVLTHHRNVYWIIYSSL